MIRGLTWEKLILEGVLFGCAYAFFDWKALVLIFLGMWWLNVRDELYDQTKLERERSRTLLS